MRVVVSFVRKRQVFLLEKLRQDERKKHGNPFSYSPERVKSCREPAPGCSDSTVYLFFFLVLMFGGGVGVVDGC